MIKIDSKNINAKNLTTQLPITLYRAEPPTIKEYIHAIISNRHLINVLAWQEIRSIYAQTFLGLFWAILRPLLLTLIFTAFFKGMLNLKTQSPYYLFVFTGMISWNFFGAIVNQASSVMVQRRDLIRRMQFPKIILPFYKILVAGIEVAVALVFLIAMIVIQGLPFHLGVLTLPLFILLNIVCGFTISVWSNALSIKFRDLHQLLPTLIGTAIWLTPVFYPTSLLPARLAPLLYLNPMAGVIKGFRYALLGEQFPEWQYFISFGIITLLAIVGSWYLSQVEDRIVDYV